MAKMRNDSILDPISFLIWSPAARAGISLVCRAQSGFVDQNAVPALRTGEKLFILPEVLFGDTEVLLWRKAQHGGALFDALDGFLVEVHWRWFCCDKKGGGRNAAPRLNAMEINKSNS